PASGRRPPAAGLCKAAGRRATKSVAVLLRVQLDDQLLLDGQIDLLARRHRNDAPCDGPPFERQPFRNAASLDFLHRVFDGGVLLTTPDHRDDIALPHRIRRDVDLPSIDLKMSVAHELTRLWPRGGQAETIYDVVEPALEQLQQRLSRD